MITVQKHAKIRYFKQFQSHITITYLELGITDLGSVSLVSPWPWRIFLRPIFFSGLRWKILCIRKIPHTIDELKMAIAEYIWNVGRAIMNTVFKNTVRRVNKCLEIGGGHLEHYL